MSGEDLFIDAVWAFVLLFAAALIIALLLAVTDTVQERRAFSASVACEQQRMIPRRNSLSATVLCVPAIQRQDTTTVRVTR